MTTPDPSPQRAYRAACPNCGAPVDFRSAASASAVCSFCKSTLVRDGESLRRIGVSADLFDDHSPLQLGVTGAYQGAGFALVGRLQYRYGQGTWNEWHALFDNGRSAWLSEDNGTYVLALDQPLTEAPPPADRLVVGAPLTVAGRRWQVASVTVAKLIAAQGELPHPPVLDRGFVVADLRSDDTVGTLDYGDPKAPSWSAGRSVGLDELRLVGLKETTSAGGGGSERTLRAGGLQCPNCGAALEVKLTTTQSVVCHQCKSVIDVSQGLGGDLAHYAQENGSEPLIPLGTNGALKLGKRAGVTWQVVGYVERCEVPEDAEDDEQSFWREYLLYNRTAGFAFLIDAEDGWSWSVPVTGAPEGSGAKVRFEGDTYRKLYDYRGQITYVLGEFYWHLTRDQLTANTDYLSGTKRLNREETREDGTHEVVWSAGESLSADTVQKAFRLASSKALVRDASPTSSSGSWLAKLFLWGFVLAVFFLIVRCDVERDDCSEPLNRFGQASQEYQTCLANNRSSGRTSGGSWGGFSSGGGHK